jgi:tetratricopeptide (TPR) repeat protein
MDSPINRMQWLFVLLALAFRTHAAEAPSAATNAAAVVLTVEGTAEVFRSGGKSWEPAKPDLKLYVGDQFRTGPRSRASMQNSNLSVLTLGADSKCYIEAPPAAKTSSIINIKAGLGFIFHRDKPQDVLRTPRGTGAIKGTEFNVLVGEDGETTLTVLDGEVDLTTPEGTVTLTNGQQVISQSGRVPRVTAVLNTVDVIQWNLYYPGILDPAELGLSPSEEAALGPSLAAYREGNLPEALAKYPADRPTVSSAEKAYYGGLLLAVGLVEQTEAQINAIPADTAAGRLAAALQQLIAAVKLEKVAVPHSPELASEWLAESYYRQSRGDLPSSLTAARKAVEKSPSFGFGWARVAELEFSFGRTTRALEALNKGIELAPGNAQAVALKGFLLSAENRIREALDHFDRAIALDGALGNAWLGRGLCRIRKGQVQEGRKDLEVAAALEPNRAVLRSYLGKAFQESGDYLHASREMELAQRLDPNDPTGWLYSALLHQQQNLINRAIDDLEQSDKLKNNRQIYRSSMLLDQDNAVRGANLANVYKDAGMIDISVQEATRAVNYDYANFSAHYFLANSYNQLVDPRQLNLRYETPAVNEYLVASLLSPVGARTLSRNVTEQEYSKLFERDSIGVFSSTEYQSRGSWLQSGALYGSSGSLGYAVDGNHQSINGWRPNTDLDEWSVSAQLKYDVTPHDSIYFQAVNSDRTAGDLTQYYDARSTHLALKVNETQEPLLLAGYHHEWNPEMHTLILAGRFHDQFSITDTNQALWLLGKNGNTGQIYAAPPGTLPTAALDYSSTLVFYTVEAQQIWQHDQHTVIVGGRFQTGTFDTQSDLGTNTPTHLASGSNVSALTFSGPPVQQSVKPDFEKWSLYGYYNWRIFQPLLLSAGVSYDNLNFPLNYSAPPVSSGNDSIDQVSPKAGFTYTPWRDTTFHFAYTRSLGGVSFDQSVRLEPVQVAGFNQAFRSLVPESVAGTTPGAKFETFGLALEQKFPGHTYFTVQGEILNSDARGSIGAVDLVFPPFPPSYVPSNLRQQLDYTEKNLTLTVNQLIGNWWSVGAKYRLSEALLNTIYPDIPVAVSAAAQQHNEAVLQQLSLFALFNHSSGVFTRVEALWATQENRDYPAPLPGDDFWQFNLYAGYRFFHRQAQIQLGLLNIAGQDYQLNPLNLYAELPRGRLFTVNFQFSF